jgi:hypothetical protein
MASERDLPASPPGQRSLMRRVLRAVAIAAVVRQDIPLTTLMPEYVASPSKFD